jgi:transcriptional regulator
MYIPSYFKPNDSALVQDLMIQNSFATLINSNQDPLQITHLPLELQNDGSKHGTLFGHVARANPQWRNWKANPHVTAIFHGPHAYISPRWYTPAPDNVPTWNYAVVHVHGHARVIEDSNEAYDLQRRLVKKYDPNWNLELNEKDRQELLAGIIVFAITIETIEAKLKLSQQSSDDNHASVVKNLSQSADYMNQAIALLMKQTR